MNGEAAVFKGRMWRADEFGDPRTVLKLEESEWSQPVNGCVIVKVRACGAGLPDYLMTRGGYPLVPAPPVTPGLEVAGEVVATLPGSRYAVGDRIMGITMFHQGSGGYADYAQVIEFLSRPVPRTFSDEEAAGFLIAYRTAYAALVERCPVTPGQLLLVLGAAGSSGAAAIDMGKALGATVIAVAGGQEKADFCRFIGADHAIDYRHADLEFEIGRITDGRGVDVIFDTVGGQLATDALKCIAPFGRIAIIGFASGRCVDLDSLDMVVRNYTAVGVSASLPMDAANAMAYDELIGMADRGEIRPRIGRVFRFDDLPEILDLLENGAPPGKLIMRAMN